MKVYSITMLENLGWGTRLENYNRFVGVEVANSFKEATEVAEEWAGKARAQRGGAHHFGGSTRTAIVRGHQI